MTRRNRRRTRAHLLRELKRNLKHPGVRTFRHSLADKMLAEARNRKDVVVGPFHPDDAANMSEMYGQLNREAGALFTI